MIFDQLLIVYILVSVVVILIGLVVHLEIKLRRILMGKDARTLEDSIAFSQKEIGDLRVFQKESISYFKNIEARLSRSIQAVETIRFNPFKGTGEGGNQSFSTAFLDEQGKGSVISSLYSRDRVSIFSKPLSAFNSQFDLTDEEKEVIEQAKKNLSQR